MFLYSTTGSKWDSNSRHLIDIVFHFGYSKTQKDHDTTDGDRTFFILMRMSLKPT